MIRLPILFTLLGLLAAANAAPVVIQPAPARVVWVDDGPDLEQELKDLAATLACCGEKDFEVAKGVKVAWKWKHETGEWVPGYYRERADGMAQDPPTNTIRIWPEKHGDYDDTKPLAEQPDVKAEFARTIAHECLHWKCPPHKAGPAGNPGAPPDPPPDKDGRDPDCNDLNYAYHTATALCAAIQAAAAAGDVEYCEALKASYAKLQAKWNTEKLAEIAEKCACKEPDPWDPEDEGDGDEFEDCPDFPVPPAGCGAEEPFPGHKFIPDCNCVCEEEQ